MPTNPENPEDDDDYIPVMPEGYGKEWLEEEDGD